MIFHFPPLKLMLPKPQSRPKQPNQILLHKFGCLFETDFIETEEININ